MRSHNLRSPASIVLMGALFLPSAAVAGQSSAPESTTSTEGTLPRLPWGDPDLQGIWNANAATPLERPAQFAGKEVLSEEDVARLEQEAAANRVDRPPRAGDPGTYNRFWTDGATRRSRQTSVIVDPPDGRLPTLTPAARRIDDARADALACSAGQSTKPCPADSHEDLDLNDRCIVQVSSAPPLMPYGYNANHQILQAPGYVAIVTEMIHDVRIIPLDGPPPLPSARRLWNGDSRGRWEGDTLVVETANFLKSGTGLASGNDKIRVRADFGDPAAQVRVIERFTRLDADTMKYQFTIEDSARTRPYSGDTVITRTDEPLYEYACHEGNYGMLGILSGARASDGIGTH